MLCIAKKVAISVGVAAMIAGITMPSAHAYPDTDVRVQNKLVALIDPGTKTNVGHSKIRINIRSLDKTVIARDPRLDDLTDCSGNIIINCKTAEWKWDSGKVGLGCSKVIRGEEDAALAIPLIQGWQRVDSSTKWARPVYNMMCK